MIERKVVVVADTAGEADVFAVSHGLPLVDSLQAVEDGYAVVFSGAQISLVQVRGKKRMESLVDFVAGEKAHRRRFGGGKGQAIAKAVGLNRSHQLSVIDATAGMGGDAFVLATLGCQVVMIERCPIVRLLLKNGLQRAARVAEDSDPELLEILQRMILIEGDSLQLLQGESVSSAQVVYLDPMFPVRNKSAEVKKEMQFFHDIVGTDPDADQLLEGALSKAINRVVVKRPRIAPYLAGREPGYQLQGKSGRFDIYPLKAF